MTIYICNRCGFWSRDRQTLLAHLHDLHAQEGPILVEDLTVWTEPARRASETVSCRDRRRARNYGPLGGVRRGAGPP